jgi:hypothetical protein
MYQTNKQTKYYVYNCIKQAYLHVAENWNDLIDWIAQYNYTPHWSENIAFGSNKKIRNRILDDFNCTFQDTSVHYDWDNVRSYLREYTVFDDDFRIIDMRLFEKEILAYRRPKSFKRKYKTKAMEYKYEKTKPEFRNGPVPRTGKRGWYCGIRHPHTLNEMRQNCDIEHRNYVRKRRKHLPTTWDDIFRSAPRSWKDQSKKKKQWM